MSKPFFITTAIDYTNGAPHIGHAYEKVLADVLARYHRLRGEEVFFLTGVDQHGQKVQQSAEKQGLAPQEFVDGITAKFLAIWEKLGVKYDRWAATTDPLHKQCVQGILQRLFDEGKLYKAKQGGYYSVRQEQFLTDKERNEQGEFGPEWGEVEFREEENYYFKLAEHKDWLLALIDKREDLVTPSFRRTELRNAVEKLAGDLCVSRPKARLAWGIELPFDRDYVTFVWFDALVNYISFADYEAKGTNSKFSALWPALHVIGKDIMIPAHGVYWPIMLKGLGFTDDQIPPLLVHGWWNISGEKMSKTLGNVVDPDALADKYSAEALRYYLMSDIATGRDADFSELRLIQRFNNGLANGIGNLLNRTLTMTQKYREGKLKRNTGESKLAAKATETLPLYHEAFQSYEVHRALSHVHDFVVVCNGYIQETEPFKLAKDPAKAELLDAVLYDLAESLRIIAILISPVLPKAAQGILSQLNQDKECTLAQANWGELPDGHVLGSPVPLFPRLEEPKE